MAVITLAAAGNSEQGINRINPRFQAEALRQLRGFDTGVLLNSFSNGGNALNSTITRTANESKTWKLELVKRSDGSYVVNIQPGMATAYGYDIQNEASLGFSFSPTTTTYYFVYLRWDLSGTTGKGELLTKASTAYAFSGRQDNLINNAQGVYEMPLYRITFYANGGSPSVQKWTALGVAEYDCCFRATNADKATEAKNAATATNANYATNAGHATAATTADNYSDDGGIATALSYINQRLTNLGFREGKPTGTFVDSASALKRQGNYVIGYIKCNAVTNNKTLCTMPVYFRPSVTYTTYALVTGYDSMGSYFETSRTVTINTNGTATIANYANGCTFYFKIGFEAPAI